MQPKEIDLDSSEAISRDDLLRDSTQTIQNGNFNPLIEKEDSLANLLHQLPKQVHHQASNEPDSGFSRGRDQIKETTFEYQQANRVLNEASAFHPVGRFRDGSRGRQISEVVSPKSMASKYEQKLIESSKNMQFSEQNTKLSSIKAANNSHEQYENLVNDMSIDERKNRVIGMGNPTNRSNQAGLDNVRGSIEDSKFFYDNEINRELERSRSNPRNKGGYNGSNAVFAEKIGSPILSSNIALDDDEITERIRLQGERLIQQPDIIQSQPHKQLERAMKDQTEGSRERQKFQRQPNSQADKNQIMDKIAIEEKETKMSVTKKEDSVSRHKRYRPYNSREVSNGREENSRAEIFDGSFGRKKRQDNGQDWLLNQKFKIESKPQISEQLQSVPEYDRNIPTKNHDKFERKFGIGGPSGRANRTSRVQKNDFLDIGSGIPLVGQERRQTYDRNMDLMDVFRARESKSIPRESIAFDHLDNKSKGNYFNDTNFSDLVKKSETRRTYSTSPYGGFRSQVESSFRNNQSSRIQISNILPPDNNQDTHLQQSNVVNKERYRSPLNDLYQKHHQKEFAQSQSKDDLVDEQFKQCQDLLQRAKDRRLKMGVQSQADEQFVPREQYTSKFASKKDDLLDVPDVKELQARYEYLMDTIKERDSEFKGTDYSQSKFEPDKRQKYTNGANNAKTMKWRKSERETIDDTNLPPQFDQTPTPQNCRPLVVPKPSQSENKASNIATTYDWLMSKHQNSQLFDQDSASKQPGLSNIGYHAISFGHIHEETQESFNKQNYPAARVRHHSVEKHSMKRNDMVKTNGIAGGIHRNDHSQYQRNLSAHSNERSYYKPISPEIDVDNNMQAKMQYNPAYQYGYANDKQNQYSDYRSLERDKVTIPSSVDISSQLFGSKTQSKFKIERKHRDNVNEMGSFSSTIPEKHSFKQNYQYELGQTSGSLNQNSQPLVLSQSYGYTPCQPVAPNQNPYSAPGTETRPSEVITSYSSTNVQMNSQTYLNQKPEQNLTQSIGQIGKIVRKSQKQDACRQSHQNQSLQNTYNFNGDLSNSLLNSSQDGMVIQQEKQRKPGYLVHVKNLCIDVQNSAPYGQNFGNSLKIDETLSQQGKTPQNVKTPQSNMQSTSNTIQTNLFQRLERAQAQLRQFFNTKAASQSNPVDYKPIYFSKYAPSFQLQQFNAELIQDLVLQIETLTEHLPATQELDNSTGLKTLDIVDVTNQDQAPEECYQNIGQHLKDKYDTSKGPNTWVPQLYADLCKARKEAEDAQAESQNQKKKAEEAQTQHQNEKQKNDELMQQIETLERDLLAFRKDFVQNTAQNKILQIEQQLKEQTIVELEWMERIDALLSSQQFFRNGSIPAQLPESAFDIDTANPKKVFSQLLNKLEVLLCHEAIEKSKNKKFMEKTVKELDNRISYISNKFSKIQKKVSELYQSYDEYEMTSSDAQTTNRSQSQRSSAAQNSSGDFLNLKGTLSMIKKIKKERETQDKIIEQLKQIIQIQDKMQKVDYQSIDGSVRESVLKNIENFVTEEHKKPANKMQIAWVNQVPDISGSMLQNDGQITDSRAMLENLILDNDTQDACTMGGDNPNQIFQNHTVEFACSEVQTDLNERQFAQTKLYKEVTVQTNPVQILGDSESDKSQNQDNRSDAKSSTTTDRREKQLNAFQEGLQQNMNELLTEQLSKHLQHNLNEIATIKQENGRLIEKYKNEQKHVLRLKEEVKQKKKYEIFFEKQRSKKYRNCGCQIGPSQVKYGLNGNQDDSQSLTQQNHMLQSNRSLAIKSSQNLQESQKRTNKENINKTSELNEGSTIMLGHVLKSPIVSESLRSPDIRTQKSAGDFMSLNTQTLNQKYCQDVTDLTQNQFPQHHYDSVDRQRVMVDMDDQFLEAKRDISQNYTSSGNMSKSDSINSRNIRKAKSTVN